MEGILRNSILSNGFLGRLISNSFTKGRWSHIWCHHFDEAKLFRCPCGTVATFGWAPSVSTFGRCWTWHWLGLIDVEGRWFWSVFLGVIFVAANRYKENGKKRRKFKFWQLYSRCLKTRPWRGCSPPYHVYVLYILSAKFIFLGHAPYPRLTPLGGLVLVSCSGIGQSFAEAGVRGWETSRREMGMVAHASKMMCERGMVYILAWQWLVCWNTIMIYYVYLYIFIIYSIYKCW